jgi:acetolactate synthase-1/2/3 large subunit
LFSLMEISKLEVIDALVGHLEDSGIKHVFGFPGESTLPLYQAYKARKGIEHVMAGCERCAGYMADVYARITNTIGVVDSPGGIGSPWLIPAICEAQNSSTPLLAIVSGVSTSKTEKWTTHESPQQELFQPITSKTLRLENPDRLFDFLRILFSAAAGNQPGPVMLEIPTDIMQREVQPARSTSIITYPTHRSVPADENIQTAVEVIRNSRRPIILAGGGIHSSQAYEAIKGFSTKFHIPVATSINGKGTIDEASELSLGVVGNKGTTSANDFFRTRDLAIVIGSKLGDQTTDQYRLFPDGMPIVRIEIDSDEIRRNFDSEITLVGDARETVRRLLTFTLPDFFDEESVRAIKEIKRIIAQKYAQLELPNSPVCPSFIIKQINKKFDGRAIICADASVASGWVGALGLSRGGKRNIVTPRGTGSLGFGFPATLAAKIASPDTPVFGIGGDAGFAMSVHEIETACRLGLDVHYFVLNNGALGLLESHLEASGAKDVLDKRHPTNWEAIAKGFGAKGITLNTNGEVGEYFENLPKGPAIVQVMINGDVVAPDFETVSNSQ